MDFNRIPTSARFEKLPYCLMLRVCRILGNEKGVSNENSFSVYRHRFEVLNLIGKKKDLRNKNNTR